MTAPEEAQKSGEACPECGRHELELISFPDIDVTGVRPYDELLGFVAPRRDQPPGIGCRACGATWPDLQSFRDAQSADDLAG